MKNKNVTKTLALITIGILIGILLTTGIVYAAVSASEVSYTTAKNSNIKNVGEALNDLYNKKELTITGNIQKLIPTLSDNSVTRTIEDGIVIYTINDGSGTIRTNSEYNTTSYATWKAFDNSAESWTMSEKEVINEGYYLEYEFPKYTHVLIAICRITNSSSNTSTRKYIVQGYNENIENGQNSWENISEEQTWRGTSSTTREDVLCLNHNKAYKKIRIYITRCI